MLRVFEHNVDAMNGKSSYTAHINQFADMTEKEIIAQFTGFRMTNEEKKRMNGTVSGGHKKGRKGRKGKKGKGDKDQNLKDDNSWSYDWRSVGVIGPVQHQGQCGSCTLFATAALVESYWARKGNGIRPLSPQQMLDCALDYDVCPVGSPFEPVFNYVKDRGLTSWDEYPYQARKNGCDRDREGRTAARINEWRWVA
ncbi:unnamed protein product, partial [Oppiella nova]